MQSTAEAPSTIRRDLNGVLDRQRAAFLRDGPPSLAQRRTNLKKLRTAILARKQALAEAFDADFGHRSSQESSILELLTLIWGIDYLHAHVRRFMRPTHKRVAWPVRFATARIEYQPLGVVGVIAPWNYPLSLALMPLATALAAGNRAMIKPSEITPRTAARLQRLYEWSAHELHEPRLLELVRDGNPIYVWPFEHRHVWRPAPMPLAGRVLERLTQF